MIKKHHRVFLIREVLSAAICMIALALIVSSCKIYQPAYYFKDIKKDTIIAGFVNNDLELKIQKTDVLSISISSLNVLEDALYNKVATIGSATQATQSGTQVSLDGNIYMHKLGKVTAAGLTRKELKAKLENDLQPYLKDPIATVNFANHRVTVLGEDASTIVEMPDEKIPLLEVMAASKAATPNSQLNRVMVIRQTNDTKEIKYLNLEDPSIFTSPWYYLQPNDIVVVKPNEEKLNEEQKRTRNQILYTTIISGITILSLIIDRIFR